jgi:Skp family chaperone for outer membrane proteins
MRRLAVVAALGLALGATPTFVLAQVKPGAAQKPPATPPAQVQKPATPAAPQVAPQPPKPFIEGAKIAFINIQMIASQSSEGKSSSSKVKALQDKKLAELNGKNKQLETAQGKVNQTVLSDEARAAAQKDVDRLTVEIQRFQQDADAELQELQQQLQLEFQRKLIPIVQQLVSEKGLQILLSQADAGIIWADAGVDLTAEVIKRFDAANTGAPKPPSPPQQ